MPWVRLSIDAVIQSNDTLHYALESTYSVMDMRPEQVGSNISGAKGGKGGGEMNEKGDKVTAENSPAMSGLTLVLPVFPLTHFCVPPSAKGWLTGKEIAGLPTHFSSFSSSSFRHHLAFEKPSPNQPKQDPLCYCPGPFLASLLATKLPL